MSPILVRPVREQLEHDRIIRLLHGKSRRRYDVGMNPGTQRNVPVGSGAAAVFPDLVLHSLERGRRLEAIVEVETGESVNHLEALAQWAHFGRMRVPFHLYVPSGMADVARQLCDDNRVFVNEMWSYHSVGDDVRFALIHQSKQAPARSPSARKPAATAPARTPTRTTAKRVSPKRVVPKRVSAKRVAPKRAEPKRAVAKPKRPASRPAKAVAPRRKVAPAKKQGARPKKRK